MDIFTPLYHGVLFFLPGEYLSYVTDKIKGGGGGGEIPLYHSDFFSYSFRFVSPGEWQVCYRQTSILFLPGLAA